VGGSFLVEGVAAVREARGEATEARAPSDRSVGLDAIRAIACAMVVLCHLSVHAGDGRLVGLQNGVMLFFCLSGYLLYRPFVRGRVVIRDYVRNRAVRIVPAYLVALIGVTALSGDRTFLDKPLTFLLLAQNYDPSTWQGFLGVSWTLVLEAQFYLTLPVIAYLVRGSALRLSVLGAASFVIVLFLALQPWAVDPRLVTSTYPAMLWAFVPGMLLAVRSDDDGRFANRWFLIGGITLLAIGTASPWASVDVPSALGSFLIVAWTVARRPDLGRLAPLAAIGAAVTYSMYLWHVDVIRAVGGGLASVIAGLAIAGVVYVVIERPILRLGRAKGSRLRAPASLQAPIVTLAR
jgi:peptidoglycan/LPS O-acetylase OafA/YrhL